MRVLRMRMHKWSSESLKSGELEKWFVTPEELDRLTHGQSDDPCGWDPNGGPTC